MPCNELLVAHFKHFAHSQLRNHNSGNCFCCSLSLVSSDDTGQGSDKVNREDIVKG